MSSSSTPQTPTAPTSPRKLIAAALYPYDGLVIATKGGYERTGPSGRSYDGDLLGWSLNGRPEHLRSACEGSLRRLKVDRIDLYQLHWPDPDVPLEESIGAIEELREEGKVLHVGVCNVTVEQLALALGRRDRDRPEPVQPRGHEQGRPARRM